MNYTTGGAGSASEPEDGSGEGSSDWFTDELDLLFEEMSNDAGDALFEVATVAPPTLAGGGRGGRGGAGGRGGGGDPSGGSDELIARLAGTDRYRLPVSTPSGDLYFISEDGVTRQYTDSRNQAHEERIAFRPFIPARMMRDESGSAHIELAWLDIHGELRRREVPWDSIGTTSRLPSAFGGDAVLTGRHAAACADYIQELLAENRELLAQQESRVATALGWSRATGSSSSEFTFGPGRPWPVSDGRGTGSWLSGHVKRGSIEAWKEGVSRLCSSWQAHSLILGALSAPLLQLTGWQSFAVDLSNATSTGKSKALAVAGSCCGDPEAITLSWRATGAAIEHYLSSVRGMPVLADETQLVSSESQVESVIYGLTQGRSKQRSRQDGSGLMPVAEWQSVLLTTGEKPLTSFSKKAGVVPRVVTLSGPAMAGAAEADAAGQLAADHCGHALEAIVAEALSRGHGQLVARARELAEACGHHASSPVAKRRASSVALMLLANELASEAGILRPAPAGLAEWLVNGGDALPDNEEDRARQALAAILTWAAANSHRLVNGPGWVLQVQEVLGRWGADEAVPYVALVPDAVSKRLADLGYDAEAIRREWRDRGWLAMDGKLSTVKVSLSGGARIDGQRAPRLLKVTELSDLPVSEEDAAGDARARWAAGQG